MKKNQHYEEITFLYDNEEEQEKHCIEMKQQGWIDSERKRMNIGDFYNPEYVLCGVYFKYYV